MIRLLPMIHQLLLPLGGFALFLAACQSTTSLTALNPGIDEGAQTHLTTFQPPHGGRLSPVTMPFVSPLLATFSFGHAHMQEQP